MQYEPPESNGPHHLDGLERVGDDVAWQGRQVDVMIGVARGCRR